MTDRRGSELARSNKRGSSSKKRRSSKRIHRPSFIGHADAASPIASSQSEKQSALKTKTRKNILETAIVQLLNTNYGTQVDGDPATNIHMGTTAVSVKNILHGGGGIRFVQPMSVNCNSSMDRYRCSALNDKVAPMKHGDLLVADQGTHCIHRYVCNTIEYVNVPLDALELHAPIELGGGSTYAMQGHSVHDAWVKRPIVDKRARDKKMQQVMECLGANKSLYVRCFDPNGGTEGGDTARSASGEESAMMGGGGEEDVEELHPDPEPIVIGSNTDKRPFMYKQCQMRAFEPRTEHPHEVGKSGIAVVCFHGIEHFTHCGIVGMVNKSDVNGRTHVDVRHTDYSGRVKKKGATTRGGNGNNAGSLGSGNGGGGKSGGSSIDEIALHKIVLAEEDTISHSKIKIKPKTTKGFLPNQFTNPVCAVYVNSGTFMIVDADAIDPGCSPRVQVFDGTTNMCSKIISNYTSETLRAKGLMKKTYRSDNNSNSKIDKNKEEENQSAHNLASGGEGGSTTSQKLKAKAAHHVDGCLMFRTETGVVLGDRPVPKNILGCGQIDIVKRKKKKESFNLFKQAVVDEKDEPLVKKKWVQGAMRSIPMPFATGSAGVSSPDSIPIGAEFILDIRTKGSASKQEDDKLVLYKTDPTKTKTLKQKEKNRAGSGDQASGMVHQGRVSEWNWKYSELLQWSFVEKIPTWYKDNDQEEDHEDQQAVLCVQVSLVPLVQREKKEEEKEEEKEGEKEGEKEQQQQQETKTKSKVMEEKEQQKEQKDQKKEQTKRSNRGTSLVALPGDHGDHEEHGEHRDGPSSTSGSGQTPMHLRVSWVNATSSQDMYSVINLTATKGGETTISSVKKMISTEINVNPQYLRLFYDDIALEDNDHQLQLYNIKSSSGGSGKTWGGIDSGERTPMLKLIAFIPRDFVFFKSGDGMWCENEHDQEQDGPKEKDPTAESETKDSNTNVGHDLIKNTFYYTTNHVLFYYGPKYFPVEEKKSNVPDKSLPSGKDKTLKKKHSRGIPQNQFKGRGNNEQGKRNRGKKRNANKKKDETKVNLPWYSKHIPLQIHSQLRPIVKFRAKFRIWHKHVVIQNFSARTIYSRTSSFQRSSTVGGDGANMGGENRDASTMAVSSTLHEKRLGKYAPPNIEEEFHAKGHGVRQGLQVMNDQLGYTPWVTVVVHGYDPIEKFHRVEIEGLHSTNDGDCELNAMWREFFKRDTKLSVGGASTDENVTPATVATTWFNGYFCEYPYCDNECLQFVDSTKCLIERPLFRSPKGIAVPLPKALYKMNKSDYENEIASSFYVTDSVHSVVHNFQHPLKGLRGFSSLTKSTDLFVKKAYQWSFGSRGSMPGEFCNPHGMASWTFDNNTEDGGTGSNGSSGGTDSEREHIIVADTDNNRIQCFVRIVSGSQTGVHFECMYPEDDETVDTYHQFNGILDGAMARVLGGTHGGAAATSGGVNDALADLFLTSNAPDALMSPMDVSIQVVNGIVMVYVCDTGNHCVRVLVLDVEKLTEDNLKERTYSSDSFAKIPQHTQWMYSYHPRKENYVRQVARRRLMLVATW